jgi:drug/metabolite transporter (DMT)-like permease
MKDYVWLSVFATMLAGGQLLFKQIALMMHGKSFQDGMLTIAAAPALYFALSLYGGATLLWIWILSRVSLSQAYPWVALSLGTVPVLAMFVFNERVGNLYWLGIAFVMLGVLLTQYAASSVT